MLNAHQTLKWTSSHFDEWNKGIKVGWCFFNHICGMWNLLIYLDAVLIFQTQIYKGHIHILIRMHFILVHSLDNFSANYSCYFYVFAFAHLHLHLHSNFKCIHIYHEAHIHMSYTTQCASIFLCIFIYRLSYVAILHTFIEILSSLIRCE